MKTYLKIESLHNEDWNGEWTKADVEQEMNELGNKPTSTVDWLCWVFGHVFDTKDYTSEIENMLLNPAIRKVVLELDNSVVTVTMM